MCGIAGLVLRKGQPETALRLRVGALNTALAHRGPDGEGIWADAAAGVALAQRRLAIVDLTPTGAQPMVSQSGRHVITYNGEIYNFPGLRHQLEEQGVGLRGTSDTEVLLEAWERWGQEKTLAAINGMFAFAIWDRQESSLTLVRDRFGIKPLLWFETPEGVFFASELKALLKEPTCPRAIDQGSVAAYLRHGQVPAPWTILEGVNKLEPGSSITWSLQDRQMGVTAQATRFWSPHTAMIAGQTKPSLASFDTLVDEAEVLIGASVERQMIADVPLGAFLSGGIDSSLVVALMQKRGGRRIDTFTIGFEEPRWDEAPHAAAVAQHLGTRHHTLRTSGRDALALTDEIAGIYDEPFADSSQIPTLLLCRLVRQHVSVALSGDGGDEVFAGYERYGWGLRLHAYQHKLPLALRRKVSALLSATPLALLDGIAKLSGSSREHPGHKLQRLARLAASDSFVAGYRQFLSQTDNPQVLLVDKTEHHPMAYHDGVTADLSNPLSRMQLIDALSYLPDDILVKVDRASMSVGLEVRVPLLDPIIWEFTAQLPYDRQRKEKKGKAVLRAILQKHVPVDLTERPKVGFAVPLAEWLRGDLKPWAEAVLTSSSLVKDGIFNAQAVRDLWMGHLSRQYDHAPLLWSILMFESWRRSALDA